MSKYGLSKLEYDRQKRKGVDYGAWREKKIQPEVNASVKRLMLPSQTHILMMSFFLSWKNLSNKKRGFEKMEFRVSIFLKVTTIKLADSDETMFWEALIR